MRISTIELSWFRGAAYKVVLSTDLKNVVIYGSTGSGKSSFSDAIEYVVNKGRIRHLAHEYSGSKQEKGIINTHAPSGSSSSIRIDFENRIRAEASIASDGTPTFIGDPGDLVEYIQTWQLEHLILRQDEVAAFVERTKGGKYSVLLPLLGLENLEQAAENIVDLKQSVEKTSDFAGKIANFRLLNEQATRFLPDLSDRAVLEVLIKLAKDYLEGEIPAELDQLASTLADAINQRVDSLTPEISRHALTKRICDEDLSGKLSIMLKAEEGILAKVDELLDSCIEILEAAAKYGDQLDTSLKEIKCPACGITLGKADFIAHVQGELEELRDLRVARDEAIEARRTLSESLGQVLACNRDDNLAAWLALDGQRELKKALANLDEIHKKGWQKAYTKEDCTTLTEVIAIVDGQFKRAADAIPPSNQKLIDNKDMVETCSKVPMIHELEKEIAVLSRLVDALQSAEFAIRAHIRDRTTAIIQAITTDIQALWVKLHPREPIEDVRLYMPEGTEKSIDISLKFFGIDQPSPRLTLSEGHRNSLGLCIFLALACVDEKTKRPIFLDDIVSSLDRGHRGNVGKLLLEDLADRQIILFTHDREWFQELRVVLPQDKWKLLVLRPWVSPDVGIRWSASEDTFDDARSLITQSCEVAGNCVRQIMDTNLAIAAEKLQIPMPYARGDRNDHRTCVEFLQRIMSEAKERLRKQENGSWEKYHEPIEDWEKAQRLLIALADRASHTGSLVPDEVEDLIQACEAALNRFKCGECGSYIWRADQTSRGIMQCRCGKMQWRYS